MQDAAGASEKEPLIVTFTLIDPNTLALKADTSYADIVKAFSAGRIVYGFVTNPILACGRLCIAELPNLWFVFPTNAGSMYYVQMSSDFSISLDGKIMLWRYYDATGSSDFDAQVNRIAHVNDPNADLDAANKRYVDSILTAGNSDSVVIKSSTPNSTKKFRITVDDAGAITATEVT